MSAPLAEPIGHKRRGDVMLRRPKSRGSADRVPLHALFIGFLEVSLCGFGGGLVWARRVVVEQRRWMDEQEFAETLTLCQLMPGPNIVGIAVSVGAKLRGAIGAVSAVAGFILAPWTVGLAVGGVVLQYAEIAVLQNILAGLSASAAGLLIGTGLRLLTPHRNRRSYTGAREWQQNRELDLRLRSEHALGLDAYGVEPRSPNSPAWEVVRTMRP